MGKMTHKIEKSEDISYFEVLDILFKGLKASPGFYRET